MIFIVRFLSYWEILVVYTQDKWEFPQALPEKYEARITDKKDVGQDKVIWVSSSRHSKPSFTCKNLLTSGLWVCQADFKSWGGVPPAAFGASLPPFRMNDLSLESWATPTSTPRVAYHGTSREFFHSISSEGLRCTYGMLGDGVYIGSFWKACRFACRGQDYAAKPNPIVFRVLWECPEEDILIFPRKWIDGWCLCGKCFVNPEQRSYCAHTFDWSADCKHPPPQPITQKPWKAGQMLPCKYPNGKWATQNEEWVINPSCIISITEAVELDVTSFSGPHYDPLQRNIKFK
jgi:hypothetical protein